MLQLRTLWESDFVPRCEEIARLFPEPDSPLKVPSWAEIQSALPDVIEDIKIRKVNGSVKDAREFLEHEGLGLKVISIGGEKLSRGLTLDGLCTSYFVRTTKMYDTLMQMGRWFGYRPGYMDLCRLYTSADLVDWFGHIADASEELREEFEAMVERGETPETYGLRVMSHPVLLVTSPLKMRTAKSLQLSFSGELVETVSLYKTSSVLDRNLAVTNALISTMGSPSESDPARQRGTAHQKWNGFLWNGIGHEAVADFFESYTTHPNARKVNSKLLAEFVRSMARADELDSWTVMLVGGGDGAPHTFSNGLKVDMLKRSDEASGTDRYSIGRLLSPRDEAIDLDESAWKAALSLTRNAWKPDATKQKPGTTPVPPDSPNGPAIRRVRGWGADGVVPARERGLLLIYPLDPQQVGNNDFASYASPVIAFGASFPSSKSGVKVEYRVDHLLWEQEYGSAE